MAGLFRSSERAEYDPEANTPLVIREYAADDDFSAFRSASALGGNEGERVNVTYVFSPVWPVPGKEEQIVGVLGRDKDETVDLVKRAFPTLARYPAGRIQFEVSDSISSSSTYPPSASVPGGAQYPPPRSEWARVMDEAWPQFRKKPPSRIRVTVLDAPGDEAKRRARDRRRTLLIIGASIAGPMLVIALIVTIGYSLPDDAV